MYSKLTNPIYNSNAVTNKRDTAPLITFLLFYFILFSLYFDFLHTNNTLIIFNIPLITYKNAETCRLILFKDNRNKSGVYRWTHIASGKYYIGSAIDISKRLKSYYSAYYLNRQLSSNSSAIYRAILKYGYSAFSIDIIEYCEINRVIEREQYYLDLLKPEYNILKTAGSVVGLKHSKSSIDRIRISNIGRKHSSITKLNIALNSFKAKAVTVTKLKTGEINQFTSIRSAALHCEMHPSYIAKCLKLKGIYNGKFYTIAFAF